MSHCRKVMVVCGTRPEAVKLAPVVAALRQDGCFESTVLVTAQHRHMLDQVLALFRIAPQYDLDLMTENQTLVSVTSGCLQGVDEVLKKDRPDIVVVQGDTTTAFASALAAFYNRIPVGHVEAGLQTEDKYSPYPEEINRRFASVVSDLHFAPTSWARSNLVAEGVPEQSVLVTGNTVVDALLGIISLPYDLSSTAPQVAAFLGTVEEFVLVTAHRRESFGEPLREICHALRDIVDAHPGLGILYPVHPNPNVRQTAAAILGGDARILLTDPVDYLTFAHLMKGSRLILTDSGGIQEEAPSLRKPVLIMRDKTERPEGVEAGVTRLVGTSRVRIAQEANRLLQDPQEYAKMTSGVNPFGDGRASQRIVEGIKSFLG